MKLRTLFAANAIVEVIFGLGFLAAPTFFLTAFGASTDATGTLLTRIAGGLILSLAIISWFGKETKDKAVQKAMAGGFTFAHLGAAALNVLAIQTGVFSSLGWSGVLIDVAFVAAFLIWWPK